MMDIDKVRPLLEFSKSMENVRKSAVNDIVKNMGIAPKVSGLTK